MKGAQRPSLKWSLKIRMKRIVTVIAVWTALCLTGLMSLSTTSKAATKDESEQVTYILTEQNAQIIWEEDEYKASVKKLKNTSGKKSSKKKSGKEKKKYTKEELKLMTCIIYCEARGESYAGQKAVGIVVMNRKKSDDFPDSIKSVIYQKGQFSPVKNGSLNKALSLYEKYDKDDKFKGEMPGCLKAAKEVLEGATTISVDGTEKEMKNYLFFSRYIPNAKYTLGNHQFK